MSREILMHSHGSETEIAIRENGILVEFYVEKDGEGSIVGNLFKGIVRTVIPSMQAAFVDIGVGKNGFLHVADVVDEPSVFQNIEKVPDEQPEPASPESSEGLGKAFLRSLSKLGFNTVEESEPKEVASTAWVTPLVPRKPAGGKTPLIQDVLKEGQKILVQVTKEGLGTKGPRLTTQIALAGKLTVLMPLSKGGGVSKQIRSRSERERLRDVCRQLRPPNVGLIVRTAGEGKDEEQFKLEVGYLVKQWQEITERAATDAAPQALFQDQNIVEWIVRDLVTEDTNRIVSDSEEQSKELEVVLKTANPELAEKVLHYTSEDPIFKYYLVDVEIENALREKVWLKSGGYLIMNQTEALVSIDVNTGKFTGQGDVREAILRTNVEAAEAVARQLRLRNLGGIVIIDFIDMDYRRDQDKVLRALKNGCRKDRARTKLYSFTELGLVEMTRKRVRRSLTKSMTLPCPECNGRGFLLKWEGRTISQDEGVSPFSSEPEPEPDKIQ